MDSNNKNKTKNNNDIDIDKRPRSVEKWAREIRETAIQEENEAKKRLVQINKIKKKRANIFEEIEKEREIQRVNIEKIKQREQYLKKEKFNTKLPKINKRDLDYEVTLDNTFYEDTTAIFEQETIDQNSLDYGTMLMKLVADEISAENEIYRNISIKKQSEQLSVNNLEDTKVKKRKKKPRRGPRSRW